jgi:SNF2 family DNA or RNA helicase
VHESWPEPSAKLIQLKETLHELKEEGHRVLIFSQFTKHLALIRDMLDQEEISYQYLDGSTPAEERQVQVDRFQNGDAVAFLISLKAGGTGLNLTAADYVIHMDPWWNPAVENQATDRAHRIGQTRPVMVYRIIAKDTIEEEILKLHESKRDLASAVLSGAETAGKLSTSDLIKLIRG